MARPDVDRQPAILGHITPPEDGVGARTMVRAALMGAHTHTAEGGQRVHIWRRGETYLARGRLNGLQYGETLGADTVRAEARLRALLADLDNGAYVLPSERRGRPLARKRSPRLSLRRLADDFLAEKRATRGAQTAGNYRARLAPVLDFAERPANLRRWPHTAALDREFVVGLLAHLHAARTTRNGRPGGEPRPLSTTQVRHALETLRTLLAWAAAPAVAKLPAGWAHPVTADLVPPRPSKDPLRADPVPLDARVRLVAHMDRWQLCQLAWSLVLPLRPDEAAGLLIADVDAGKGWLEFGHRLVDCNFTKGRTRFVLPYPDEFRPILRACIGGRGEGPLLRGRRAFGDPGAADAGTLVAVQGTYQVALAKAPAGAVQAAHDRKRLFRRLLRERWGGVSEDRMAAEFKCVAEAAGQGGDLTLYSLRHATTRGLKEANLPHLELRYLTGHVCDDILNVYTGLDVLSAMGQYFASCRPLLSAIARRANELGLSAG